MTTSAAISAGSQDKGMGYYLVATLVVASSLIRWFRAGQTAPREPDEEPVRYG